MSNASIAKRILYRNPQAAYEEVAAAVEVPEDTQVAEWIGTARKVLDKGNADWLPWAGDRLMPETSKSVSDAAEKVAAAERERNEKDRADREAEQEARRELLRKGLLKRFTSKEITMKEFSEQLEVINRVGTQVSTTVSDDKTLDGEEEPENESEDDDEPIVMETTSRMVSRVDKRKRVDSEGAKQPLELKVGLSYF
jgi:hypothetical protein